jgi:hypothetical protein
MAHVLDKTYISRKAAKGFIKSLISNEKLAGEDPKPFWKKVNFLNIQENGDSQADLLELFDESLDSQLGFGGGRASYPQRDRRVMPNKLATSPSRAYPSNASDVVSKGCKNVVEIMRAIDPARKVEHLFGVVFCCAQIPSRLLFC